MTVLERGNIFYFQEKYGIKRGYKSKGIPETVSEITYSEEEINFLSKPLIYHTK